MSIGGTDPDLFLSFPAAPAPPRYQPALPRGHWLSRSGNFLYLQSVESLARRTGISARKLRRVLGGERWPDLDLLLALAQAARMSPVDVVEAILPKFLERRKSTDTADGRRS